MGSLQEKLVNRLIEENKTIAVAESCTGGLVSKRITSIPGASRCFGYGIVTYANHIKEHQLGVKHDILAEFGAVSPQVAEQMSKNAKIKGEADIGIGITGIAGPGGATKKKPIGLVYVSAAFGTDTITKELRLSGGASNERELIRSRAASHALSLALQVLNEELSNKERFYG